MIGSYGQRWSAALVILALGWPAQVLAKDGAEENGTVEGVVIAVTGDEMIVDLGSQRGVPDNAKLQFYRRVVVRHPVTGEEIQDRFPIGAAEAGQVGARLTLVKNWQGLSRAPVAGDYVIYTATRPAPAPARAVVDGPPPRAASGKEVEVAPQVAVEPAAPRPAPAPAVDGEGMTPERAMLENAWEMTMGEPLEKRITIYRSFLEAYPQGRYAEAVAEELAWLRAEMAVARGAVATREEMEPKERAAQPPPLQAQVSAPPRLSPDEPLEIVATLNQPTAVRQVRVLMKQLGATGAYRTMPMERMGDYNWRLQIPAGTYEEGNQLAYFVEAVTREENLELLEGSAATPQITTYRVEARDPARIEDRSRVSAVAEYVDFNSFAPGDDAYLRVEADYRYRLQLPILVGWRVGAGVFQGAGASVDAIARYQEALQDPDLEAIDPARQTTLGYGFAEAELAIHEYFGLALRVLAGNQQGDLATSVDVPGEGFGARQDPGSIASAYGARAELRLGAVDGTRLMLGGTILGDIGAEAWLRLMIESLDRIPMSGEAVVTNLPVGADIGVSLNYGIGYQFTDLFALMLRVGLNARTTQHLGLGGGLGTILQW